MMLMLSPLINKIHKSNTKDDSDEYHGDGDDEGDDDDDDDADHSCGGGGDLHSHGAADNGRLQQI